MPVPAGVTSFRVDAATQYSPAVTALPLQDSCELSAAAIKGIGPVATVATLLPIKEFGMDS